ncbi:MAG: hypothetical protein GYA14_04665 [Ignavibacteria bacterium]|nr:hypothetical protein [Ignavibacteria bacterium]
MNDLSKKGPVDMSDIEAEDENTRSATFNPDARYEKNSSKQDLANELFNSGQKTSQDEIDKLFGK